MVNIFYNDYLERSTRTLASLDSSPPIVKLMVILLAKQKQKLIIKGIIKYTK